MEYLKLKTIEYRFCDKQVPYLQFDNTKITDAEIFYRQIKGLFHGLVVEQFHVYWLNTANRIMGYEVISSGTLNSSVVHPREVFRGAILATCAGIILAHNHPSGNINPSDEDIKITNQLVKAGVIIGIKVMDHIIVGDDYYSFAENGLL